MEPLFDAAEPPILSVGQLSGQIQATLERAFPFVRVVGEIASLSRPNSGHVYFNLKDANAVVRAVVYRNEARRLFFDLKNGLEVVGRGRISVYTPRGDYQLILDEIVPKGLGAHDLALKQLKEKLAKLGFFAQERKKPIPRFPRRLALVTSPSGAAVRDMLEILGRRWPQAEVWICPVKVQGDDAPLDIVRGLALVERVGTFDTVILGRGGGSSGDLAAFNHEAVARAIFRMPMPVISAVGHEIDLTIADLVADRRALTPSEAAELATPDRVQLAKHLTDRSGRLQQLLTTRLRSLRQRLDGLAQRRIFRAPLDRLRERERRLDDHEARLHQTMSGRLERGRNTLRGLAGQLESLSPLNVLARGYSLTRTDTGRLVRSVAQVHEGQSLEILLADGVIDTVAERVKPKA